MTAAKTFYRIEMFGPLMDADILKLWRECRLSGYTWSITDENGNIVAMNDGTSADATVSDQSPQLGSDSSTLRTKRTKPNTEQRDTGK